MEKNKKPNLCSNTSWCTMIRVRRWRKPITAGLMMKWWFKVMAEKPEYDDSFGGRFGATVD